MNKATQRRYVRRLRTFVAAFKAWRPTKARRFDMRNWWRERDCGTVHCAWGLAPSIPSFRRAGIVAGYFGVRLLTPDNGPLDNLDAATEFLGLTSQEAAVFMPLSYRSERWRMATTKSQNRNPIRKSEVTAKLNALLRKKEREFTEAHGGVA